MQDLTSGQASTVKSSTVKASTTFLPIINLNPTDEHCIYSTLLLIISQAKQINVIIPCVTFDQLLLKTTGIIAETNFNIVARLGGFHTVMSLFGGIGNIMKESGLEELFPEVYAELSVEHMSGKAVPTALRAHFLAESALMTILIELVNELPLKTFLEILEENIAVEEINEFCQSNVVSIITQALQKKMDELASKSRTARFWLFYLHYIRILNVYIVAERTSNWPLHIQSSVDMLNLLLHLATSMLCDDDSHNDGHIFDDVFNI